MNPPISAIFRLSSKIPLGICIKPNTQYYRADDNFICSLVFEDGSIANLTYTALGTREYPKEQMEIYVDGTVVLLNNYKRLKIFGLSSEEIKNRTVEKGHRQEHEAFAECILKNKEWPIPLWQQIQATKIALAGDAAVF